MRYFAKAVLVAAVVLLPALSHAQSLAGTVRDASGGVLPGVTVEAASPVLIEKVRTATSDNAGQYRIENLPPGTYSLTYTLPGFTTVKRDGVELSGSGVLTINSEMRVGGIQETITVTGESPVVDTQTSTRRQMVLSNDTIQAHPGVARLRQPAGDRAGHSGDRPRCQLRCVHELLHRARRTWQRRHGSDRRHERRVGVQRRRRRGLRLSDW